MDEINQANLTMQKLDPLKKEAITEAARVRFYRYGIQKTTLQDIAKDVGIAVGTLYLYFKNKDDILNACTQAFEQKHLAEIKTILSENDLDSNSEKLKRYILQRFIASQNTREGSDHAAEIARAVIRVNPGRLAAEACLMQDTLTTLLQRGCDSGELKISNIPNDVEVFLYSIAYFFPIAGKEPCQALRSTNLEKVVNWFLQQWKAK